MSKRLHNYSRASTGCQPLILERLHVLSLLLTCECSAASGVKIRRTDSGVAAVQLVGQIFPGAASGADRGYISLRAGTWTLASLHRINFPVKSGLHVHPHLGSSTEGRSEAVSDIRSDWSFFLANINNR